MKEFLKFDLPMSLALVLAFTGFAQAGELDADSLESLQQTQAILANPSAIKAESAKSEKAKKADDDVRFLMGNDADTASVYGLASEIFADLVKKSNGDPDQLQKLIEEAQRNPAAFGQSLSDQQKSKLKELGNKANGPGVSGSRR